MRSRVLCGLLVLGLVAAGAVGRVHAQQQTLKGMISDSTCGGDHGGEVDVVECTQKCIRNKDKYVLATNNGTKVVPIANQDFADLAANAGKIVNVTGEMKNGALTVSKIVAAP